MGGGTLRPAARWPGVQVVLAHYGHVRRVVGIEDGRDGGRNTASCARRRWLAGVLLRTLVLVQLVFDHVQHQIFDAERRRVLARLSVHRHRSDRRSTLLKYLNVKNSAMAFYRDNYLIVIGSDRLVGGLGGTRVVLVLLGAGATPHSGTVAAAHHGGGTLSRRRGVA